MTSKLFFEELRCYVRSEKHLNYIQSWTESFSPCIPLYLWQKDANTHKKDDSIVNPSFQERLFPKLDTNILGNIVLYKHAMASTQTLLYEELKPSAPEFTICYTDVQIKGKGRGSNIWTSPDGCLMFSFKSSFTDGNSLPFVQYLISLAIVKAFETIQATKIPSKATAIGTKGSVRIKWPNDLYVDKLKIGGILCQSEFHDGKFDVTTGIGINIFNQEPTTCIMDVLQKEDPTCHLTKEEFLAAFCNAYEPMVTIFKEKGFSPFLQEYLDRWLHTNQIVQVSEREHSTETIPATIKGLTLTGCLLAESCMNGERLELYPDGNSFDFLTGLLKRKL